MKKTEKHCAGQNKQTSLLTNRTTNTKLEPLRTNGTVETKVLARKKRGEQAFGTRCKFKLFHYSEFQIYVNGRFFQD